MSEDGSNESRVDDWLEARWLHEVADLVSELRDRLHGQREAAAHATFPYVDSIAESLGSFQLLASALRLRDAYVIARTIYETALNACFVLTNVEELTARANAHANQKALRNLTRAVEIAGAEVFSYKAMDANEVIKAFPELGEQLAAFTSRSGRELTSWTPENVQMRLEAINAAFGADSTWGLTLGVLLYRHASEIAHGSLFGTLFSWGAMEIGKPLRSIAQLGKFRRRELRLGFLQFSGHIN